MPKNLTIAIALLLCSAAVAQLGMQLNYVAPLCTYKYLLKPALGAELIYNLDGNKIDKRFKLSGSISFHRYKPTQDTFRIYSLQEGGTLVGSGAPVNGTALVPGWAHLKKMGVLGIGIRSEFKVLDKKLSPLVGLDLYTYIVSENEDYDDGMVQSHGDEPIMYIFALAPRAGLCYQIKEKWLVNAGMAFSYGFYGTAPAPVFAKTFLNAFYYFNR